MLSASDVHTTKMVDQLLFRGYEDALIELGRMAADLGEDVPPFDKFGWFYMVRWYPIRVKSGGKCSKVQRHVAEAEGRAEIVYLIVSRARRRSKMRFALL